MKIVNTIALYIAGVILLVILFLFALNGRYTRVNDQVIFDKWEETVKPIEIIWEKQGETF
ncbi:MAG: hypothetical protein J6K01_07260 [Paludibacteraceae bacterium]|nr:hypothetical protein [Paludibacteraceae bacterium]